MAQLSRSLFIFSDGEIEEAPSPSRPPLWRVLHDKELGTDRDNIPEVFPFLPNHHVPFDRTWQLLSKAMNPLLSGDKWRDVYWYKLWITNNQGFDIPGDPRVDYVNGRDIGAPLPRVEALTCGGNVLTGYVEGPNLIVSTLDWRNPPASIDVIPRWHRTYAVTVDSHGTPRRFPQGEQPNGYMADVIHPLMADPGRFMITFPLSNLQKWTRPGFPDPYTFYV